MTQTTLPFTPAWLRRKSYHPDREFKASISSSQHQGTAATTLAPTPEAGGVPNATYPLIYPRYSVWSVQRHTGATGVTREVGPSLLAWYDVLHALPPLFQPGRGWLMDEAGFTAGYVAANSKRGLRKVSNKTRKEKRRISIYEMDVRGKWVV